MIDAVVIRRWLPVSQHVLSFTEIEDVIRTLLRQYRAEYALLFGSYARGEATPDSDLDVVVVRRRFTSNIQKESGCIRNQRIE